MKKEFFNDDLAPGLISTFRNFTILEMVVMLLLEVFFLVVATQEEIVGAEEYVAMTKEDFQFFLFFFIYLGLIIITLSIPWFYRKLKGYYFPSILLIYSLQPLAARLLFHNDPWIGDDIAATAFIFMVLPVILVAWQYSLKIVVIYLTFYLGVDILSGFLFSGTNYFTEWLIFDFFTNFLILLYFGWMVGGLAQKQRDAKQKLSHANLQLIKHSAALEQLAVSRERNRLARELHDTLAHTLSAVSVQLEAVKTLREVDPQKSDNILDQALVDTRAGLTETRKALRDLRASPLTDLGLGLAVRNLAESTAERCGLTLKLRISEIPEGIPLEQQQFVLRAVQEALMNIDRHARARTLKVNLIVAEQKLRLLISDDGVGFDPARVDDELHYGLRGIRERAELLGAEFDLHSNVGKGTKLELRMELA